MGAALTQCMVPVRFRKCSFPTCATAEGAGPCEVDCLVWLFSIEGDVFPSLSSLRKIKWSMTIPLGAMGWSAGELTRDQGPQRSCLGLPAHGCRVTQPHPHSDTLITGSQRHV